MKLTIIAFLTLIVFVAAGTLVRNMRPETKNEKDLRIPLHINGWKGRDLGLDDATIDKIKPDAFLFRNYQNNGGQVNLYVGYYSSLKKSDSAHLPTICYPAQGWKIVGNSDITVFAGGKKLDLSRLKVSKGATNEIVYFGFMNNTLNTNNLLRLRTDLVKKLIQGKKTDNALIRFSMPLKPENNEASDRYLGQFITDVYPFIDSVLQEDNGDPYGKSRI